MYFEHCKIAHQPTNNNADEDQHGYISGPSGNYRRGLGEIVGKRHSRNQWNQENEDHVRKQIQEADVHGLYPQQQRRDQRSPEKEAQRGEQKTKHRRKCRQGHRQRQITACQHGKKVGSVSPGTRSYEDHAQGSVHRRIYDVYENYGDNGQQDVLAKQPCEQCFPVVAQLPEVFNFNAERDTEHDQRQAGVQHDNASFRKINVNGRRFQRDR